MIQILTTRLMVHCMGGGSEAHEDEERNSCRHLPGPEGVTK